MPITHEVPFTGTPLPGARWNDEHVGAPDLAAVLAEGADAAGQDATGFGTAFGRMMVSERVLSGDVVIPVNGSAVIVGPLDLDGHTITFGAGAAMAILS